MAKLDLTKAKGDEDATMTAAEDARVTELENRMMQLEHTVKNNQHKQEQNHLEVTGHVSQLQSQVETQSGQLQRHFDQRMQEQLDHIERLLRKRSGE